MMKCAWFVRGSISVLGVVAAATPVALGDARMILPVDSSQSSLTAELCLLDGLGCDTDTSPASGFFEIQLDDNGSPSMIALHDFALTLTEPIDLNISFSILGAFNSTSSDISLTSALFDAAGPEPVNAGSFTLPAVDAQPGGLTNYTATGLVCSGLQGAMPPLPCVDTLDLTSFPPTIAPFAGQVFSVPAPGGHNIIFGAFVDITIDLVATDPGLAVLQLSGVVQCSAFVPAQCDGDADNNASVDVNDISFIVFRLGTSGVAGFVEGDVDENGTVDVNDITFTIFRLGTPCS